GASIGSAAGALAISVSGGAVGAAVSSNDIKNHVRSRIEGATVSGQQVQVGSTEDATIVNVTAAGSGAGNFALGGSASNNLIRNTVDAHIAGGSHVTGASLVGGTSSDTSTIDAISGQAALAANVGIGLAAAGHDIANTTH